MEAVGADVTGPAVGDQQLPVARTQAGEGDTSPRLRQIH
jgi:hypothetical protein